MMTQEERDAWKRRVEERKNKVVAERTAHARSLAQVAGAVFYTDPRGRAWGIRTFALRDSDYFQREFLGLISINGIATNDNTTNRIRWASFVQKCVWCNDPYAGAWITVRRAFGLPDYSVRTILKNLIDGVPPSIVNTIIFANYDKKSLTEMLATPDKNKNTPDTDGASFGELMASYFYHKGISPNEFLGMTQIQLNAINDFLSDEKARSEHEERLNRIRNGA